MAELFCEYCKRPIRDQDELITASRRFRLRPFHYQCFETQEEETVAKTGLWIPVNGATGNVTAIIMLALAILMFATDILHSLGDLLGVLAIYPVILRISSYFFIESKLPKLIQNKKPIEHDYDE